MHMTIPDIDAHLPLVHFVARSLEATFAPSFEYDELVSAGTLGLLGAAKTFDPTKGFAFSTCAAPRIRGAILDEVRRCDTASRMMRRRARMVTQAKDILKARQGRSPRDAEVARVLDIPLSEYHRWRFTLGHAWTDSIDAYEGADDAERANKRRQLHAPEHNPLAQLEAADLRRTVGALPKQQREVIQLYYFEGLTLWQIGELLGVSESRVSQVRQRALCALRVTLAE